MSRRQGCIKEGRLSGTKADPGYDPPSWVTKQVGCDCFYVYLNMARVSLELNPKCALHGQGTPYYDNLMTKYDDRLKELYRLRDEKYNK